MWSKRGTLQSFSAGFLVKVLVCQANDNGLLLLRGKGCADSGASNVSKCITAGLAGHTHFENH